jgi:hypothetical protein
MLKAAAAVIAGFVSIGLIGVAFDFVAEHLVASQYGPSGEVHSTWMLIVILTYTMLSCVCGGYIAATIAREHPRGACLTLGALMVLATLVACTMSPAKLPLWWKTLGVVLTGPAVVAGAYLRPRTTGSVV